MVSSLFLAPFFAAGLLLGQSAANLLETPTKTAPPAVKPEIPLTPERRGDILMARKMYREAVDVYKEGPAADPILLNKIGIAYHQLLDFPIAKKYYERSVKAKPNYAEALNNLGTVYYAQKSYRRAIGYYRKALKITPNSASIHSNLGTAYFARHKFKEAMESYETALKLDPDVFEHRGSAGVLLQERSVQDRAKFHYYMAKSYAKAGMNDRALLYIRKALEEGFTDRQKFIDEPEFSNLQELQEFKEVMSLQPRVL